RRSRGGRRIAAREQRPRRERRDVSKRPLEVVVGIVRRVEREQPAEMVRLRVDDSPALPVRRDRVRRGLDALEPYHGDAVRRLADDLVPKRGGLHTRVRGVGEPDQDRSRGGGRTGEDEGSGEDERGTHWKPLRQPPAPSLDSIL